MRGRTPPTPKIPVPELIRRCDHSASHGPVLMRALGPRQTILGVDPHGESHVILWTARGR